MGSFPRCGGILGRGDNGSRVGCLHQSAGGAPVYLRCQCICEFNMGPVWKRRHPAVWFWQSIAVCLSIAAITFLCPGNSTPHFFSSWTLAWRFLIRDCISSIATCEILGEVILAISKARRMLDCSSCTRPPCFALVADILKSCKTLVAASNNEIRLLSQPYMLP